MAYVGEGRTRWSAAHIRDVAKLYVLALEKGEPGARYHGSAEEGVTARAIAEAIGQGAGLEVRSVAADEVERYLGWMAPFAALDMAASSAWTRARLGWEPSGPDLLTDLAGMDYAAGSGACPAESTLAGAGRRLRVARVRASMRRCGRSTPARRPA